MNFFAPSREKQPLRKSIDLDEPVELSKSIQMLMYFFHNSICLNGL